MVFQSTREPAQASLSRFPSCRSLTGPLALNNVWAGLAVGIAFFATIVTRGYAGSLSDRRGAKVAAGLGLAFYAAGAATSLVAGLLSHVPAVALLVLLAARLVLGVGESLVGVGVITWGVGIVGLSRSARVLALIGAAIYGALAVGGPTGLALLGQFGFAGAMAVSALLPCLGLLAIWPMAGIVRRPDAERPSFRSVVGKIWWYGMMVCLQGIGFASIGWRSDRLRSKRSAKS